MIAPLVKSLISTVLRCFIHPTNPSQSHPSIQSGWKQINVDECGWKWMRMDEKGWKWTKVDENIHGATCILFAKDIHWFFLEITYLSIYKIQEQHLYSWRRRNRFFWSHFVDHRCHHYWKELAWGRSQLTSRHSHNPADFKRLKDF